MTHQCIACGEVFDGEGVVQRTEHIESRTRTKVTSVRVCSEQCAKSVAA